jgi:hypothetical protein
MKNKIILGLVVLSLTTLMGCGSGGGGGGGNQEPEITRELLAGSDLKQWFLVAIRGNANYEGGGVDRPCAATLKKISNPALSFRCGRGDEVQMRATGTFTYLGAGVDWSLSGSTLTLNLGSTLGVMTSTVSIEPTATGAPQRLRLRQISRVVKGVRNTDEDGCEIVIELGT